MRRLSRIFRLGLKEMVSLRRDRVMAILLVYSFSLGVMMDATGHTSSVNNASIAFVDEDRSALSRALAAAFRPPEFQQPALIAASQIDAAMDAGRYLFVVGVPPGFEADLRRGRAPVLQVLVDATAMEQAGIGAGYIAAILDQETTRFVEQRSGAAPPPVELVTRAAFNPNRDTVRFGSVVSLIGQISILTIILTGAALIREREHGTIEHLLAMPLAPFDIAMAKIWANGAVVLAAAVLSMLVVVEGVLGVEPTGSRLLFFAGTVLYLFAATAIGVFLATVAKSMAQFALLFFLTILPMQLLSGGDMPVEGQPEWLQVLTVLLPSRHFIESGQAIIYKGAGLDTVWPAFLLIAVTGAILLAASLALFRRSIAADR